MARQKVVSHKLPSTSHSDTGQRFSNDLFHCFTLILVHAVDGSSQWGGGDSLMAITKDTSVHVLAVLATTKEPP